MAMEALLGTLEREAEEARAAIEREAGERARQLLARAEAEVAGRRATALEREAARRGRDSDRELALHRRRLLGQVLRAREEAIDRVLGRAQQLLAALPAAKYRERVPSLVAAVREHLAEAGAVLRCPSDLEDAVRSAAGDAVSIESRVGAPPGVVARSADGALTVDGSWTARLATLAPELRVRLAAQLTPAAGENSRALG